ARHLLNDPSMSDSLIPVWVFLGGAIYALAVYWLGGGLLFGACRRLGSLGTYRRSRQVLGLAAAPLALSLLTLWPVRIAVCGTDLHIFHWDAWAANRIKPPLTLGHEFAGTVVDVGRSVRNVTAGEYVSAESHVTCGACYHCRTGRAHMCEFTQILGVDRDG